MLQLDYMYWNMIKKLLVQENYQVIQLSDSQNEIWLETSQKNTPRFIRILRYDIDWSNWLQRDLEITAQNVTNLTKRLNIRTMDVINIYVTTHEPVDDWKYRFEKPMLVGRKGQSRIHSLLLHQGDLKNGLASLSPFIGSTFENINTDNEENADIESLKQEVLSIVTSNRRREQQLFNYSKPVFTYIFIVVQILMFILLELNGGSTNSNTLIKFGAKENIAIINGEWWRFFTPIILHIGIFHLLMNTLALYYIGTTVEKIFGKTRFIFIYLFAGFMGSLASFVFSPNISAGASGAIFGCFGALLYFGSIYPKLFIRTIGGNIIGVILLNLVFGFIVPGIDNAGHIGGLVGGFLATSIVHLPNHKQYGKRLIGLLATIATVGILYYVGYIIQPFSNNLGYALSLAKEQIEEKDFEKAYITLEKAANKNENSAELYFYLSFVEINIGDFEKAKEHLIKATAIDPSIPESHFNLALVYIELKDFSLAKESLLKAINIDPNNNSYQELLTTIDQMIDSE